MLVVAGAAQEQRKQWPPYGVACWAGQGVRQGAAARCSSRSAAAWLTGHASWRARCDLLLTPQGGRRDRLEGRHGMLRQRRWAHATLACGRAPYPPIHTAKTVPTAGTACPQQAPPISNTSATAASVDSYPRRVPLASSRSPPAPALELLHLACQLLQAILQLSIQIFHFSLEISHVCQQLLLHTCLCGAFVALLGTPASVSRCNCRKRDRGHRNGVAATHELQREEQETG